MGTPRAELPSLLDTEDRSATVNRLPSPCPAGTGRTRARRAEGVAGRSGRRPRMPVMAWAWSAMTCVGHRVRGGSALSDRWAGVIGLVVQALVAGWLVSGRSRTALGRPTGARRVLVSASSTSWAADSFSSTSPRGARSAPRLKALLARFGNVASEFRDSFDANDLGPSASSLQRSAMIQ
jgi:hypothetical protein